MAEWSRGCLNSFTISLLLCGLFHLGYYCIQTTALTDDTCDRDGHFGRGCRSECQCKDGAICDKITGVCRGGCRGQNWGKTCHLDSSCSYEDSKSCSYSASGCIGGDYAGKVDRTTSGTLCRSWIDHGTYSGDRFVDGSRELAKNYCRNPGVTDAKKPWCYTTYRGGWGHCDIQLCDCPQFWFGKNCEKECLCYNVNEVCDSTTGECPQSGCIKGKKGSGCETSCADGKFGINCEFTCHCAGGVQCNKETGLCPGGCGEGWSGEACLIGSYLLNKPARQNPTRYSFPASQAVDNDPRTCSRTDEMYQPWWRVDLLRTHVVMEVNISLTASLLLGNFKIWLTATDRVPHTEEHLCRNFYGWIDNNAVITCDKPMTGRYLYIQRKEREEETSLPLCDVRIKGYPFKECLYNEFGPNCNQKCRCEDKTEKCDIFTGYCKSGCNDLYIGENCQLEVPSMNSAPVAAGRTQTSIRVKWNAWKSREPQIEVAVYRLEYATDTSTTFTDGYTSAEIPGEKTRLFYEETVENLKSFTYYQFRVVIGVRHGSGSIKYGRPGKIGRLRTQCSAPAPYQPKITTAAKERGTIQDMEEWPSKITLPLSWQATPAEDLNCDALKEYNVYYNYYNMDGIPQWYKLTSQETSVNVKDLNANLRYYFHVGVVNSDGLETNGTQWRVITRDGRPGNVTDLKLVKVFDGFKISWLEPGQSYGTVLDYYVQYRHLSYGTCKNFTRPAIETSRQSFTVMKYTMTGFDVCNFCKYRISVFAANSGANGTESVLEEFTSPAAPEHKIENLQQLDLASRHAMFSWSEYRCEWRNGPDGHYVMELMKGGTTVNTKTIPIGELLRVTWNNLIPYTSYMFRLVFRNRVGDSPPAVLNLKTQEEVPPPPTLEKLQSTPSSVYIQLIPPDPPHGIILKYQISYQVKGETETILTTHGLQHNISSLLPDVQYVFKARGRTQIGYGNWSDEVIIKTEDDYPGIPENLRLTEKSTDSLTLVWEKPTAPLVILHGFQVTCVAVTSYSTPNNGQGMGRVFDHPPDINSYTFTDLTPATQYNCSVRAAGKKGYGEAASEMFWTKPTGRSNLKFSGSHKCCRRDNLHCRPPEFTLQVGAFWSEPFPFSSEVCTVLEYNALESVALSVSASNQNLEMSSGDLDLRIIPEETTDETITVLVPDAKHFKAPVSKYLIGVEDMTGQRKKRSVEAEQASKSDDNPDDTLRDYAEAKKKGQRRYITAEINGTHRDRFTIGDGKTYGKYHNVKLTKGQSYAIFYGVVSYLGGEKYVSFSDPSQPVKVVKFLRPAPTLYIIIAVVFIILLVILALGAALFLRQRRQKFAMSDKEDLNDVKKEEIQMMNGISNCMLPVTNPPEVTIPSYQGSPLRQDKHNEIVEDKLYVNAEVNSPNSHAILLDDLIAYVVSKRRDNCNGFKTEYREFLPELEYPHEASKLEENKGKTRFKNIVPYDHSRVILVVGPESPNTDTDYINANYIDGYKKKRAYIAAQGPTKMAINDIWRAVWQERCPKIIMLTNFVELGKLKCERYWPESGTQQYGQFTVEHVMEEKLTDVTITNLKISKDGQERRLKHFHFTSWPDHGVPKFASTMLHFWREVTSYSGEEMGPVYVHCSAGVGRTGTFIGLDYLIQQGSTEKLVNIYECVKQMRKSRPKMVQTWEQYVFLHEALAEHFKIGVTAFPSSIFVDRYGSMVIPKHKEKQSRLQCQYKLLSLFDVEMTANVSSTALSPENLHKNRDNDIVPEDKNRPYLTLPVEGHNNYINAVFVDGFSQRDQYVVTQTPLASTVVDFWRLVHDHRISCIVMLNTIESKDSIYWPSAKIRRDYSTFTIECLSENNYNSDITVREFRFTRKTSIQMNDNSSERLIRQFQLNSWQSEENLPHSSTGLVTLLSLVDRWQQESGEKRILVHCMDGATRSGIFCVANSVLEKNQVDHDIDVFQMTRLSRVNRRQLINSYEQYKFVHDIVSEYIQQFNIYANFV